MKGEIGKTYGYVSHKFLSLIVFEIALIVLTFWVYGLLRDFVFGGKGFYSSKHWYIYYKGRRGYELYCMRIVAVTTLYIFMPCLF